MMSKNRAVPDIVRSILIFLYPLFIVVCSITYVPDSLKGEINLHVKPNKPSIV